MQSRSLIPILAFVFIIWHVSYSVGNARRDIPLAATLVLRFARAAARILAGLPPGAGEGLLSELGDRRVEPTLDRSFVTDGSTWIS
jgi:hypothetical protein